MVLLICLPFGIFCEKIGLPTLFGYVMTGVLLGPSGLNIIKSMVILILECFRPNPKIFLGSSGDNW